jgi:fumarate reductase flavoprotein subunit
VSEGVIEPESASDTDVDLDVDVVVAGGGGAGLAAALSAAQGGATVVLAEARQNFHFDCNTSMSTSMVPAGGTRWQRELGIDDSPQAFYDDILIKTRGTADPTITRALTDIGPELVAWLNDACDVPLELPTDFLYPGHSRHRCHCVHDRAGATLHRHMLEAVQREDSITLVTPARLSAVELDDAHAVAAATLGRPDRTQERLRTRAVILAVGGFGANRELVHRFIPEIENALYFGSGGNQGDALSIGEALGADTDYLDAYQGHGSVATPQNILCTWISLTHGGILVNAEGQRFGDEMKGYSEFARYVVAQRGGFAYVVLDRRIHELCKPFADYQALDEQGGVRWVDDSHGLAAAIGAPPVALAETLQAANEACQGWRADRFGRTHWEAALSPPFAFVKVTGALFHTQGGLLVDGTARVLRRGEPLRGLYAAGGSAAGVSGRGADGYMGGNGLLGALGLGYLAGRSASR